MLLNNGSLYSLASILTQKQLTFPESNIVLVQAYFKPQSLENASRYSAASAVCTEGRFIIEACLKTNKMTINVSFPCDNKIIIFFFVQKMF